MTPRKRDPLQNTARNQKADVVQNGIRVDAKHLHVRPGTDPPLPANREAKYAVNVQRSRRQDGNYRSDQRKPFRLPLFLQHCGDGSQK